MTRTARPAGTVRTAFGYGIVVARFQGAGWKTSTPYVRVRITTPGLPYTGRVVTIPANH